MPTYIFLNRNTGQLVEEVLRMSDYDAFVCKHPHLERYHDEPANFASEITQSRREKTRLFPQEQPSCEGKKRQYTCNCLKHRLSRR